MKYFDPTKFDDLPDEPSDSEYLSLYEQVHGEYYMNNCYDGTKPKLKEYQKEQLREYWKPRRDYDDFDVKMGIIKAEQLDALTGFIDQTPPVKDAETFYFNWRWQTTSNANSQNGQRDRLRLGKVYTRTQTFDLWGFESWQEFSGHCHIADKHNARQVYEELSTLLALSTNTTGQYSICCWVVKNEGNTKPGCWAISFDYFETKSRSIYMFANGVTDIRENIQFNKTSKLGFKGTK